MLDLAQVGVRIAFIHQSIQVLGHLPDALLSSLQAAVLRFFLQHKIQSLVRVVLPVELRDRWVRVGTIVPELLFRFSRLIASRYKIIPIVEFFKGCRFCKRGGTKLFIHGKTPTLLWELAPGKAIGTFTSHRPSGSGVHAEWLREDSSTAATNRIPSTPSLIPGTRSA